MCFTRRSNHGRKIAAGERLGDLLESQAGVELLLHPLRLGRRVVDPAGLFAATAAVEYLRLG